MRLYNFDLQFNGESTFRDSETGEAAIAVWIESPAAAEIADLLIMHKDLGDTVERAEALLAFSGDAAGHEVGALYESMLIAYGRCFGTGRSAQGGQSRRRIQHLVEELPTELRQAHDEALTLRDRWIAHRVDGQEGAKVIGVFSQAGAFLHLSPFVSTLSGDSKVARALKPLAEHLGDAVLLLIEQETSALEQEFRDRGTVLTV